MKAIFKKKLLYNLKFVAITTWHYKCCRLTPNTPPFSAQHWAIRLKTLGALKTNIIHNIAQLAFIHLPDRSPGQQSPKNSIAYHKQFFCVRMYLN